MSIKLATHLYRNRHGMFYFRYVIPRDLKNYLNKSEIRFSLKTEQRCDALYFAAQIIIDLPRITADLRRMKDEEISPPPTTDEILAANFMLTFRNIRLDDEIKRLKRELADLKELSVPRTRAKQVAKIYHEKGQLHGKKESEDKTMFPWSPERTILYSELMGKYISSLSYRAEGGTKKPPTEKTFEEYGVTLSFFITIMGDVRIGAIDQEVVGEYFKILKRLPKNISRVKRYIGKSIPELMAMVAAGDEPQSESNCSKKVERASTMFKWALKQGRKYGIDANPFEGFGQSGDNETSRRPFTQDELHLLLNHPTFIKKHFTTTYSYWLMPLAIFTGARLGELTQLDLQDFVEIDGIWCVDINDAEAWTDEVANGRKKRVKSKSSRRLVPIHRELIEIGILRYVATLRKQGNSPHLFPELSRTRRDGTGHAASNWFQRHRAAVGITAKQEAVFHSFRNLFITNILDTRHPPHLLAPIVGHETKLGVTGETYWNKKNAVERQPTVEVFKLYEDVRQLIPNIEDVTFAPPRAPKRTARRIKPALPA